VLQTEQENKAILLAGILRQPQCLTKPQIHPPLLYVLSPQNEPILPTSPHTTSTSFQPLSVLPPTLIHECPPYAVGWGTAWA